MSGPHRAALPCANCGLPGKSCKGCRLAFFCSVDCLKADWENHCFVCTSKKHGNKSPAPMLELVQTATTGAGLKAAAKIELGEVLLREEPLLISAPMGAESSAEKYAYHVVAGVEAFYNATPRVRKAIMTELHAPDPVSSVVADGGNSVTISTARQAEQWRDASWISWASKQADPSLDPDEPEPAKRLPLWLGMTEFTRFLLAFQSNAWSLPQPPDSYCAKHAQDQRSPLPAGSSVLLRLGSKFNHSCQPNVGFEWDFTKRMALFRALRPIASGEELCVSYLVTGVELESLRVEERGRLLGLKCGMEGAICRCDRCVLERSVARIHE